MKAMPGDKTRNVDDNIQTVESAFGGSSWVNSGIFFQLLQTRER